MPSTGAEHEVNPGSNRWMPGGRPRGHITRFTVMVNSDFHRSDSELKIIELYSILSSFTCMHVWPVLRSQRHRMIWTAVQNNNVYVLSFQGYFLLFESMLDSVLYARDLYLADTGSGWSHLLLTIGLGIYIYISIKSTKVQWTSGGVSGGRCFALATLRWGSTDSQVRLPPFGGGGNYLCGGSDHFGCAPKQWYSEFKWKRHYAASVNTKSQWKD